MYPANVHVSQPKWRKIKWIRNERVAKDIPSDGKVFPGSGIQTIL